MATLAAARGPRAGSAVRAGKALKAAAVFWFVTAAAGQALFAIYIAAFYGASAVRGDVMKWNEVLPHGIISGDPAGNVALGIHLALAFVITASGPLQLVPALRARAPRFHRWNGRAYVATALLISLAALYLVWSRSGLPGWSVINSVAISINALLIMLFASAALRCALIRDFAAHRRWALRLFIAVSGVWFLRIGVMLWILVAGPAGLGENLSGPAGIGLAFAQYIAPLGVLELYLRARESSSAPARYAIAALLGALTLAMAAGLAMVVTFMWLPRIV